MKKSLKLLLGVLALVGGGTVMAGVGNARYVDPFLGVDGGGNVLPGPCLPFSLVRINPVVELPQPTSGYQTGKPLIGFVQTNVSGTGGGGRYGNFMVTPQSGKVEIDIPASSTREEQASVGYYSVVLERSKVRAELTSTEKVGIQRFTFLDDREAYVLISASSVIDRFRNRDTDGRCLDSRIRVLEDGTISGFATLQGGWGHMQPYTLYFCAAFDRPFVAFGTWQDGRLDVGNRDASGTRCGACFSFGSRTGQQVMLKVAVSTLSEEQARINLRKVRHMGFEQARKRSVEIWNRYLDRIEIRGGTPEQRTIFYTSLYRAYVMPTDITGENPLWVSDEPCYWDFYCIWDTFRTNFPLYTLLTPDIQVKIIRSLLDVYRHRGWMPEAWIVGGFCKQQGGTDADNVIADAVAKGLEGFDRELAYQAMVKNAEQPADEQELYEGLTVTGKYRDYIENGYVPEHKTCCVSYTLEYAYNDYCLSQVARSLGKGKDAAKYLKRSLNCYNLFDPATGFFRAKDTLGRWMDDFDPARMGNPAWLGPHFYEGTSWHYSTYVLHDIPGLIDRHGGKAHFTAYLDRFFDGRFFTHDNEPDIHAPYLYNYVGQPWKTAEKVAGIIRDQYRHARNGLPGNDDSGTLSSWYVFSSLGFYPFAGQEFYLIGTPLFEEATIRLPGGKKFVVRARNLTPGNIYVQRVWLNGKPYDKSWIVHLDLVEGGELCFEMGDKPSSWAESSPMPEGATSRLKSLRIHE